MTDEEAQRLRRDNDYLKLRCAQLQDDVTDRARRAATRPAPLSGGQ